MKGLDAAAKFMNANILTSSAGCEKWQQAQARVLGNPPANITNARLNRAMLTLSRSVDQPLKQPKTFATLS
jgi:hypothetical protein